MVISPDEIIFWQYGPITLNATIVFTWVVMAIMVLGSWLVTRKLRSDENISRGQNALEAIVALVDDQISEISAHDSKRYIPFIGPLFLFIATAALLSIIPGFRAPTASLSTTTALAICVFIAVPLFGILSQGVLGYLRQYLQPTPFMLPFNIIGDFSRTLALAVRLFGNVMSGTMIAGILLTIVPLFFPVVMEAFGLLIGFIQAYIFAVLAMVYIAAAIRQQDDKTAESTPPTSGGKGDENDG